MDRELQILITKAKMGDITPEEKARLQQASLGLAPSSREFQQIAAVLGTPHNTSGNTPNMRQPTLDWASGIASGLEGIGSAIKMPSFAPGGAFEGGVPGLEDIMWGRSTPTLDFLSDERGNPWFGDDEAPPATEQGIQGDAPVGSGFDFPKFGQPQASTPSETADPEALPGMGDDLSKYYTDIPDDYSFSDFNREGLLDLTYSPERFARNYATEMGREGSASMYVDPVRAAMAMASTGAIGPGGVEVGDSLQSALGIPQGQRLQAVEDFMDQYTTKGVDIRPDAIFEEMFNRSLNTDMSKVDSPQTEQPLSTDEIIDYTNSSLLTAAPFMVPEAAAQIESTLQYYANEYKNYIATTDGTPMSYPAFLQSRGVDQLLKAQ
jgi:hypothetical protein